MCAVTAAAAAARPQAALPQWPLNLQTQLKHDAVHATLFVGSL